MTKEHAGTASASPWARAVQYVSAKREALSAAISENSEAYAKAKESFKAGKFVDGLMELRDAVTGRNASEVTVQDAEPSAGSAWGNVTAWGKGRVEAISKNWNETFMPALQEAGHEMSEGNLARGVGSAAKTGLAMLGDVVTLGHSKEVCDAAMRGYEAVREKAADIRTGQRLTETERQAMADELVPGSGGSGLALEYQAS